MPEIGLDPRAFLQHSHVRVHLAFERVAVARRRHPAEPPLRSFALPGISVEPTTHRIAVHTQPLRDLFPAQAALKHTHRLLAHLLQRPIGQMAGVIFLGH